MSDFFKQFMPATKKDIQDLRNDMSAKSDALLAAVTRIEQKSDALIKLVKNLQTEVANSDVDLPPAVDAALARLGAEADAEAVLTDPIPAPSPAPQQ